MLVAKDIHISTSQISLGSLYEQRETSIFHAQEIRRNILTEGIDLNVLVGGVFAIGAIKLRGSEETIPCKRISALTHKAGFYEAFAGRGGIRAEVLISGTIKVGDPIDTIASQMSEKN